MTFFANVIKVLKCTLIFGKIPMIFQTYFKTATKTCFSFWFSFHNAHVVLIDIYNGYLVIISIKVLIMCQTSQNFSKFLTTTAKQVLFQ